MIDPDLNYCPQCDDEYRADIQQCAGCGIALISGAQRLERERAKERKVAERKGALTDDDEVVSLERGSLHDMKILEERLVAENIGTRLVAEQKSCGGNCCPSTFFLQVRRDDVQDALQILAEEHRRLTGQESHGNGYEEAVFNPLAGEATCPACGFTFQTSTTTCPDCGLCFG